VTDWNALNAIAATASAMVALAAAGLTYHTFTKQKLAADSQLCFSYFDRISSYWDRCFEQPNPEAKQFYTAQALSFFEAACFVFNRQHVSSATPETLAAHIEEIWERFNSQPATREYIDGLRSTATIFREIETFLARHRSSHRATYYLRR
jgi:hypothetical protein